MRNEQTQPFNIGMGVGTPYEAIIHFTPNDDICGEGYEGFDFVVSFSDTRLHSWMWKDTYQGDKEDVLEKATTFYNEIVRMLKTVSE